MRANGTVPAIVRVPATGVHAAANMSRTSTVEAVGELRIMHGLPAAAARYNTPGAAVVERRCAVAVATPGPAEVMAAAVVAADGARTSGSSTTSPSSGISI